MHIETTQMTKVLLATTVVVLVACQSTEPVTSHEQMMTYLASKARNITDQAIAEISSQDAWESVRERRLSELRDMLGLDLEKPRTPLHVEVRGSIERPGYVIEKIAFQSMPHVYVTANLYMPTEREGPVPAVIYVCGHGYSPHGAKASYQRHGHTLAKHGYATLVIDPIQIAETVGLHHGSSIQEMYEWYTRAYSPAGVEVWNVIRALDYLESREEVDAERFAITGRSGGAAMSWFAAAVEPRIKAVVPIMGISTTAAHVADDTQKRHCDCMFPVNFSMQDMLHLGALISPRPLLTAHGRQDALFPVAGYEEFEEVIASLYGLYEAEDRFSNLVVESGHEDSDFLRTEAVQWLDRWLMQIEPRDIDTQYEEVEASELAVFGGEPPEDALNYKVHEFFIPDPEPVVWQGKEAWHSRREELLTTIRESVLHAIPANSPVPETRPGTLDAPDGYLALQLDYDGQVAVEALLQVPEDADGPALLHVASPDEDPRAVTSMLRNLSRFGRNPVLVLYPPGTANEGWSKSSWKTLLRNAMQTGSTVDTIRIGSILAGIQVLKEHAGSEHQVVLSGIGQASSWTLYAALLDETVEQVIMVQAPRSHFEGPILLGAMRHVDLPDVAALLAPRRLTFYGQMPTEYERTREIYEKLGVGSRFKVSMSLAKALNGKFGLGLTTGL